MCGPTIEIRFTSNAIGMVYTAIYFNDSLTTFADSVRPNDRHLGLSK